MEIRDPRRILCIGPPDSGVLTLLKGIDMNYNDDREILKPIQNLRGPRLKHASYLRLPPSLLLPRSEILPHHISSRAIPQPIRRQQPYKPTQQYRKQQQQAHPTIFSFARHTTQPTSRSGSMKPPIPSPGLPTSSPMKRLKSLKPWVHGSL
jgi:hypothetical protein